MNARAVWVMVLGTAGILAVGSARADDDATKARISAVERRIADLRREVRPAATATRPATPDLERRREIYAEIRTLTAKLTALKLGPKLGPRYEAFVRRSADLTTQYRALYADKSLDAETRNARAAEIRKRQTALSTEYADVIREATAVRTAAQQAVAREKRLKALRPLLAMADDEWAALRPTLRKLLERQDDLRRVTPTGPSFRATTSYLWKRPKPATPVGALAQTVQKTAATPAEIEAAIKALRAKRAAEAKKRAALAAEVTRARAAVKGLLTVRQEAVLIVEGVLD